MAITSELRRSDRFIGNGSQAAFPFNFKVFSSDQVKVVIADTDGAETVLDASAFSVSLSTDQDNTPGGTVTLKSPLARDYILVILSNVPSLQPTVFTNRGGFFPAALNDSLDRVTILTQQLQEKAERTLVVPVTEDKTPQQLISEILDVASKAGDYANQSKEIHDDVVARYDEIIEVKEQVEQQAAVFEGALESIENARDDAVGVVAAEGDKIKNEVGGLVANAEAIAQSVANSVATVNSAVASASASASSASSSQALASQSADTAVQAKSQAEAFAQSAEQQAKTASFAVRYLSGAVANSDFAVTSFTPNNNVKVGDHVLNYTGDLFQIVSITNGYATLGSALTSLRGPEGPQGIRGEKGESIVGPEGPQGIPGIQGETGSGLEILDTFNSESQLPATGNSGDAYFVGEDLYLWSPSANAWVNKGPIAGGGGITGLMSPDPRTYFLYVLNGGVVEDEEGGGSDSPETDTSYGPILDTGKLDYLVLA